MTDNGFVRRETLEQIHCKLASGSSQMAVEFLMYFFFKGLSLGVGKELIPRCGNWAAP